MSINTARETARLEATATLIRNHEATIKRLEDSLKPVEADIIVKEANYQSAVQVFGLLAVEAVSILKERVTADDALTAIHAQIIVATKGLLALETVRDQQKEALEKQEFLFPSRLKRHLRRCKKFGWTDARLKSSK